MCAHVCTKFSNQSICWDNGECAGRWHRLLLRIITPFLSAAAWFPQWRQLFRSLSYFHLCSTTLPSSSLPLLISDWHVWSFPESKCPTIPYSKNICLKSPVRVRSQMEGYTLEMPWGMSLVRLFRRNLQMLKRVSGMWELKGSSWRYKWLKMRDGKWRDYRISDKNMQV